MKYLKIYSERNIRNFVSKREGEIKIGEKVRSITSKDVDSSLSDLNSEGARFVLIGIPESIGPAGNYGKTNSNQAFSLFLSKFLNMQHNRFVNGEDILCLGEIQTNDLLQKVSLAKKKDVSFYHKLTNELDKRVREVICRVVKAGLIPVVIGGGHNNAYPLIGGAYDATGNALQVVNCDPHADFRNKEGRHSGNPFSYAASEGVMSKYFIVALHEQYNSEAIYKSLEEFGAGFNFYEQLINNARSFSELIGEALKFFKEKDKPTGIELDMDAITNMPASAFTPSGISLHQARQYIAAMASGLNPAYLHLPEGASGKGEENDLRLGKSLAYIVADFIKNASNK